MNSFSPKIVFQLQVLMFCGASVMASRSNVTTCSCYGFYNQKKTWSESERKCEDDGGHLVTMETEEEYQFINKTIQSLNVSNNEWYIGLNKSSTGNWKWITGQSMTINKRRPSQPSETGDCVKMIKDYRGLLVFDNVNCTDSSYMFICEYKNGGDKCNSSTTFPFNCSGQKMGPTPSAVDPTTACTLSDPDSDPFNLVYVVIALGILLAGGIGFYIYMFYCKNRTAGFSLGCKEYEACEFKTRASLQMEEGAIPLQAREPTTETVLEDDSNKTETTTMPITNTETTTMPIINTETTTMPIMKTESETLAEPQDPAQDTVEDAAATQDYTLPADPSSTSTYAALYSTVDIEQKKPEENEDIVPPKIPSPYHKASREPVVYATVDKSKKNKGKDSHVEVVYATVDKKRKNNKDNP